MKLGICIKRRYELVLFYFLGDPAVSPRSFVFWDHLFSLGKFAYLSMFCVIGPHLIWYIIIGW